MKSIPEIDDKDIPDEEDDEEDSEEKIKEKKYNKSIQISTLNTQVVVESNDPHDKLKDLKKMIESIVDKYENLKN